MDILTNKCLFQAGAGISNDKYGKYQLEYSNTSSMTGQSSTYYTQAVVKARTSENFIYMVEGSAAGSPWDYGKVGVISVNSDFDTINFQNFIMPNSSHELYNSTHSYANRRLDVQSYEGIQLDPNDNIYFATRWYGGNDDYNQTIFKFSGTTGGLLASKTHLETNQAGSINNPPYRGYYNRGVTANPTIGCAWVRTGLPQPTSSSGWYNWLMTTWDTSLNMLNWKPYGAPGEHWMQERGFAENTLIDSFYPYGRPSVSGAGNHTYSYHIGRVTWTGANSYSVNWDSHRAGWNEYGYPERAKVVNSSGDVVTVGKIQANAGTTYGSYEEPGFVIYHRGSDGAVQWQKIIGPTDKSKYHNGGAVGYASNGDVITAFGSSDGTLIIRFNSSGTVLWQVRIQGLNITGGSSTIELDSDGDICLTHFNAVWKLSGDGSFNAGTFTDGSDTYTISSSNVSVSNLNWTFSSISPGTSSPYQNYSTTNSTSHYTSYNNLYSTSDLSKPLFS